jgi:N-acetylneuraminate synthase
MEGWDHKVSATKDEMSDVVEGSKRIVDAMGSFRVSATESNEKKKEFRRSIVITRDMAKGDTIKIEDIDYKRPGGNLSPEMTDFIIGRTINKDIKNDHILTKEDIV